MTLLDSSRLLYARSAGAWPYVMQNLDQVVPFYTAAGTVHEFVAKLKAKGKRIGIVTSSPRNYSEELLRKFQIPYDFLVSGSEVANHKPHPEGILKCMDGLKVASDSSVYIGDAVNDYIAAYRAGILSIGCVWGNPQGFTREMYSKCPDIVIKTPDTLLVDVSNLGFRGERIASNNLVYGHAGDVIEFAVGNVRYHCLGRFFDSKHRRTNMPLSQAILKFKNDDSDRKFILDSVLSWLNVGASWIPDLILSVPPKPGTQNQPAQSDRFISTRDELSKILKCEDGKDTYLSCIERIDNYKLMKEFERAATSDRIYKVIQKVDRRNILLLDDVVTTGSTTNSIANKLYLNGAADVRCIGLGLNQLNVFDDKICPACGGQMRIRINGRDSSSFWGCSNYTSQNCRHTEKCE